MGECEAYKSCTPSAQPKAMIFLVPLSGREIKGGSLESANLRRKRESAPSDSPWLGHALLLSVHRYHNLLRHFGVDEAGTRRLTRKCQVAPFTVTNARSVGVRREVMLIDQPKDKESGWMKPHGPL